MSSPSDNGEKKEVDNGEHNAPPAKVEVSDYVVVLEDEGAEPMELPVNKEDNSLGLNTLTSIFPGSHGLKFKNPKTGASRAIMVDATGTKFLPPLDGWEGKTFTAVFSKGRGEGECSGSGGEAKRKGDGGEEEERASKQKRYDDRPVELIVLGLNYITTAEMFRNHFEQFGKVVSADLKMNNEGQSKGFGFVLMSTLEEQNKVLSSAIMHKIDGRRLEVKIPDDRSENFRNPQLPSSQTTNKVFVGRLHVTTTQDELRAYFEEESKKINPHATIIDCFLPRPSRGFGFVTFSTCEMARQIVAANNFRLKDSPLALSLAVPRESEMGGRGGGPFGVSSRAWNLVLRPGGSSIGGGYGYGYGAGRDDVGPSFGAAWAGLP
ncbi:hypothetical protein PMAYCL1PPCAC_10926, partial [Pristionchus mayeri]